MCLPPIRYQRFTINAQSQSGGSVCGSLVGNGMLELPSDFTPPSRFVRAVAFSKTALPVEKAKDGILQSSIRLGSPRE